MTPLSKREIGIPLPRDSFAEERALNNLYENRPWKVIDFGVAPLYAINAKIAAVWEETEYRVALYDSCTGQKLRMRTPEPICEVEQLLLIRNRVVLLGKSLVYPFHYLWIENREGDLIESKERQLQRIYAFAGELFGEFACSDGLWLAHIDIDSCSPYPITCKIKQGCDTLEEALQKGCSLARYREEILFLEKEEPYRFHLFNPRRQSVVKFTVSEMAEPAHCGQIKGTDLIWSVQMRKKNEPYFQFISGREKKILRSFHIRSGAGFKIRANSEFKPVVERKSLYFVDHNQTVLNYNYKSEDIRQLTTVEFPEMDFILQGRLMRLLIFRKILFNSPLRSGGQYLKTYIRTYDKRDGHRVCLQEFYNISHLQFINGRLFYRRNEDSHLVCENLPVTD